MKKFLEGVITWKSYVCFMFSGCVCLYSVIALLTGERTLEIGILFQLLLLSAFGTLLQGIAFDETWVIKKAKYTTRLFIFIIPFFALLTAFAFFFQWFPTGQMMSWVIFLAIFLVIFVVMTVSFEIIFRVTGKKYDGLLGQYKKKSEETNERD